MSSPFGRRAGRSGSMRRERREGGAHDRAVHEVCGEVVAERPRVVLPDRLVHLRQRQHDVAAEPGDRAQRECSRPRVSRGRCSPTAPYWMPQPTPVAQCTMFVVARAHSSGGSWPMATRNALRPSCPGAEASSQLMTSPANSQRQRPSFPPSRRYRSYSNRSIAAVPTTPASAPAARLRSSFITAMPSPGSSAPRSP